VGRLTPLEATGPESASNQLQFFAPAQFLDCGLPALGRTAIGRGIRPQQLYRATTSGVFWPSRVHTIMLQQPPLQVPRHPGIQ